MKDTVWSQTRRRRSVAASLLVVAMGLDGSRQSRPSAPIASSLDLANGFGFLLGVLADYAVPAERAWRLPGELTKRLGTVDPQVLRRHRDRLVDACRAHPMLHRFPDRLARFIAAAAERVCEEYGGAAERIWNDAPTASDLQRRFERFDGIGQKKAAMAIDLLIREVGVEVRVPAGSDVAYDVHVRRVFVRTGVATGDSVAEVVAAAREMAPQRPGVLDYPSWHIGRTYCRPTSPICDRCPLEFACEFAALQHPERSHQLMLFGT